MTDKDSKISNRAKIQTLLSDNTSRAGGDFHADQLDVNSFVMDVKQHFNISPKDGSSTEELVDRLVKLNTRRLSGRTSAKELNQRSFFKLFFESFEIEKI